MYSKNNNTICPYHHYYSNQAGTGIGVVYKGVLHQQGHGIGSFLGGLFRSVLPLISSGAKAIGKEALNAGVGILSDIVSAKPLEESVTSRFHEATSNLKRKADNKINRVMKGSGYKNKKRNVESLIQLRKLKERTAKKVKKIKKLSYNDIFA